MSLVAFRREKRESSFTDTLVQHDPVHATGASLALPTATGAPGIVRRVW